MVEFKIKLARANTTTLPKYRRKQNDKLFISPFSLMTHINIYIFIYKDKIKYFKFEILNNKETSYISSLLWG